MYAKWNRDGKKLVLSTCVYEVFIFGVGGGVWPMSMHYWRGVLKMRAQCVQGGGGGSKRPEFCIIWENGISHNCFCGIGHNDRSGNRHNQKSGISHTQKFLWN